MATEERTTRRRTGRAAVAARRPHRRWTADERRDAIVAAAITEFADAGLAGASTEAIARRAGISHAYLFRLFSTKRELFVACINRAHERVMEAFRTAARQPGPAPIERKLGRGYTQLLADREVLRFQLLSFAVACGDDELRAVQRERFAEVFRWLQDEAGMSPDRARLFTAQGMLINVAAALELPELVDHGRWMRRASQAFAAGSEGRS